MITSFYYNYKFLFPPENSRTTAANYLLKGNGQSILVVVVLDAIMQMSYCIFFKSYKSKDMHFTLRNKTCFPCLHSLVKTEANVWENSRADQ